MGRRHEAIEISAANSCERSARVDLNPADPARTSTPYQGDFVTQPILSEDRRVAIKNQFENAPFNKKLGVSGRHFEYGRAVLALEYSDDNTGMANIIHGGAILALVDCAATAAAWTTVEVARDYRGITVDLSGNFIAAGRSQALTADAKVIRRGGSLTFLECTVTNEDDDVVSKSLITYKLSKINRN